MLFFSGKVLILTSICIFLQKHIAKILKSICIFIKECALKDKVQYNKTVGGSLLVLGLSFTVIAKVPLGNISMADIATNDAFIIAIIFIITIVLVTIHNFIANLIFKKEKTAPKIEDFNSEMLLPQKIQSYLETKRHKLLIFHPLYQGLLAFIFTCFIYTVTVIFPGFHGTQQNSDTLLLFITLFITTITLFIILITLALSMKQLFLTEANKADNFLPILFELDKNLVDEELNRIYLFEKKVDQRTIYNFLIGALLAILLVSNITKV